MGNDSHQAIALRQIEEGPDGLTKGLFIEGAESLVHKHGIEFDPACGRLNLIRKPQGQGERCLEGFTAGERFDTSFRAVVVIENIQFQAALRLVVLCRLLPPQLILIS